MTRQLRSSFCLLVGCGRDRVVACASASGPALSEVEGRQLRRPAARRRPPRTPGHRAQHRVQLRDCPAGHESPHRAESRAAEEILDEILRPHGLQVRSGPGGALLVVRLRERRRRL